MILWLTAAAFVVGHRASRLLGFQAQAHDEMLFCSRADPHRWPVDGGQRAAAEVFSTIDNDQRFRWPYQSPTPTAKQAPKVRAMFIIALSSRAFIMSLILFSKSAGVLPLGKFS